MISLAADTGRKRRFPEQDAIKLIFHASKALQWGQMYDTMHMNLTMKSIYLTEDADFKVADWTYIDDREIESFFAGKREGKEDFTYLAPEILRKDEFNSAADIWALAVIVYQLCALKLPFEDKK